MAAKDNPLNKIAQTSPGVASAAVQANLTAKEKQQLAAFTDLKQTHTFLTSLPQKDAYRNFNSLTPEYQNALKSFFDPKYAVEDKGFFGNILGSLKSSAEYAGRSFKELGMQIAGLPITPTTQANPAEALLTVGLGVPVATNKQTGLTQGAGQLLGALTRPQEKLVKQPYTAERLAEEQGQGGVGTYGKFLLEGFKELLPGGRDAQVADNSANWKKFWEQASDKENVFDASEVAKIDESVTPEAAIVGKMLAGRKDFIDNYDMLLANPKALSLVQRYTSGDKEAMETVGSAVARYEKAKISPGRDFARTLVSVFPFEAEKAIMGDGIASKFFTTISGGVDFGVTFGLDPLILLGKAKRSADVARFGLMKLGANPANLEKAWKNASVRRYWDELGQLFQEHQAGDIAAKGRVLTRIQERFPEINLDVAQYMAPHIKDADSALNFFRGGDIINDISKGNAGLRRDPLIPRYTLARGIKDSIRDSMVRGLEKSVGKYKSVDLPSTVSDIARVGDENLVAWADNIGYQEVTTTGGLRGALGAGLGRDTGKKFISKDATTAAKVDRMFRQFEIAPSSERVISISDASSANQIYRLMRTVLDKASASTLRAAWIAADEGQRLLMYKGVVKTLAYGMGLDHTAGGRKFLDDIENMSKELYSVNQSALDLGEFSRVLGTTSAKGMPAPEGVRKLVQEATDTATAEGKASRILASSGAEMQGIIEQVNAMKALKKELVAKTPMSTEEAAVIKEVVSDIDKNLKIMGGTLYKMRMARKDVRKHLDGQDGLDTEIYNAAELNGAQRAVRAYQVSGSRYMPNLTELRQFELRGNILSSITGRVGESITNQKITDYWSFLNLYPRLGIRTTVEEVGTYGLIGGAEGIANYVKGLAMSQEIRKATGPRIKRTIIGSKEKEVSPVGILGRTFYKLLREEHSRAEIIAMADDTELMATNIAKSLEKSKFKPGFLKTEAGARHSKYIEDFVRYDGKTVTQEINGAAWKSEFKQDVIEETTNYVKSFGPSVELNVNLKEALKDQKFEKVFSQIEYNDPQFLLSWYLDLHNTIGKKNIFGQIVFSNIYKKEEDVIKTLVEYLDGKGNALAKRFAIYQSEGSYEFAKRIYADATSGLRDYSGRLNKKLIQEIKDNGGIANFDFRSLQKYNQGFQQPKAVLGRKLIPVQAGDNVGVADRIVKNGYSWVGEQISKFDREPILKGNYLMYRDDLVKYESNIKQGLIDAGMAEKEADALARAQAHENALNFARQRTLGYVDNSDVRTNLAFNIRNFGRYYRATEDFYRRVARLVKYEKRAIQRLAITTQTFEHSGFIHKDANGEMYFTYPGDDVLNWVMGNTVFRMLGIPGAQPMSVNFGGKVKMLTPSLDPASAAPRLGGPLVGISYAMLENLPVVGSFLRSTENVVTGGISDQEWWRKFTPINLQRLIDMGIKNDKNMMTEQKFSATVQGMKLLISTGNGPKNAADLERFSNDNLIQSLNIMALRFVTGLGAPASVQLFGTKDVPKEMIDAGYFSWDAEFAKIVSRHAGDPQAFSKGLVEFATLYPSKLVYTVSKTTSNTEASFEKSYEAARFVKDNQDLINNHKQAASFFIPITGTNDLASYTYLKSQGFVKNKQLETYLREASTAEARQKYNLRRDYYDNLVNSTQDINARRYYRNQWKDEQTFFKSSYPLLAKQLETNDGYKALKNEALDDLRNVVYSGKAPNKDLANLFGAMILTYDNAQAQLKGVTGKSAYDNGYKNAIKEDLRDLLLVQAQNNPNAMSLYWNVFDPLIGE